MNQGAQVQAGSLTVVGTGIKAIVQFTGEATSAIVEADRVLYLVADAITERYIQSLNPYCESLYRFYSAAKDRSVTYEEIVSYVVEHVVKGQRICVPLYGHPTVFSYPGREAVRRLRERGFSASVLPGISAEDCLLADLGVDPGAQGCQSFEATDFLVHNKQFDPTSILILWQIALVGIRTTPTEKCYLPGVQLLSRHLAMYYETNHEVVVYEAAQHVLVASKIQRVTIGSLPDADIGPFSTLYVGPRGTAKPDENILRQLKG
jgi:precorrin-6B methylase 1